MSASPLIRLRKICLALPGAEEKTSHGEQAFHVRGKMFATFASPENHHGNGRPAAWLKAPQGAQRVIVGGQPERYFVPPYWGPGGGVGAWLDDGADWSELAGLIEEAYRTIAPKRLLAELDARATSPVPRRDP